MEVQHDHSKINSELYARYMLEILFPLEYKDLINSDKPDLISPDGSIGVEVTRVVWEEEMMAAKAFNREGIEILSGDPVKSEWENKVIGFSSPVNGVNYEGFEKLLVQKYERINNDTYSPCRQYDLYVIWRDLFEDEAGRAVSGISETDKNYSVKYRYVFLDNTEMLIRYDTASGNMEKHDISDISTDVLKKVSLEMPLGE